MNSFFNFDAQILSQYNTRHNPLPQQLAPLPNKQQEQEMERQTNKLILLLPNVTLSRLKIQTQTTAVQLYHIWGGTINEKWSEAQSCLAPEYTWSARAKLHQSWCLAPAHERPLLKGRTRGCGRRSHRLQWPALFGLETPRCPPCWKTHASHQSSLTA